MDVYVKHAGFCFACFYISPAVAASHKKIKTLCSTIKSCCATQHPSFVLGDFNLPLIDWTIPISHGGHSHEYFLDFCLDQSLHQLIHEPIHCDGNTLDLLLCDTFSSKLVNSVEVDAPFSSTCDHHLIFFSVLANSRTERIFSSKPNFRKANYEAINSYLQTVDWRRYIFACNDSVENLYEFICAGLLYMIELYVPQTSSKSSR